MKLLSLIAMITAALLLFSACNDAPITYTETIDSTVTYTSDAPVSSTEPPISSTEPPVSSTEPPVSSTEPPVSSTEPPVSSTEPPVSSTEPPVSSAEPPVSSAEPPVSSAEPPVSSTEPPVSSTEPPVSSTEPPVSSAEPTVSSTEPPFAGVGDNPPPQITLLETTAPGTKEKRNSVAVIDYSNAADGYIMVKYTADTSLRLKVQVKSKTTYTYNIIPGEWTALPLSEGDGDYKVTVYQNVVDSKYAAVISASFGASLKNEFTAFLYPNQYIDYSVAPNTVKTAYELTKNISGDLEKVAAVYDYVVSTIKYDYNKSAAVKSGYLPVLDDVLRDKSGICFDYAAIMTGMLRSQGIPCKLVVGYAGDAYHAWISVWSEKSGWVDGAIFFNGAMWQRMDPTFASSGDRSDYIMNYIGDGSNYTEKYLY